MSDEDQSAAPVTTSLRGWPRTVVLWLLPLLPEAVRRQLLRHRESLRFLVVGGICFVVAVVVNYSLKLTVLQDKPVTALTIATVVSTVLSYILNREWAFRTRGGRERPHEAALFFAVNAVAVVITDIPLWTARYLLHLREPNVSLLVQETSDFIASIVIGTALAMTFRLWAYRRWVFPEPDVRLVSSDRGSDRAA